MLKVDPSGQLEITIPGSCSDGTECTRTPHRRDGSKGDCVRQIEAVHFEDELYTLRSDRKRAAHAGVHVIVTGIEQAERLSSRERSDFIEWRWSRRSERRRLSEGRA